MATIVTGELYEKIDDGPSTVYAPELIPQGWEVAVIDGVVQDIAPSTFKVGDRKFKPFLKDNESYIHGEEFCMRAVRMKGNLGLSDAKYFLEHQSEIPTELRGKYIVFTATVLRDSSGNFRVACLCWRGDRWVLDFRWLDGDFGGRYLVACSE